MISNAFKPPPKMTEILPLRPPTLSPSYGFMMFHASFHKVLANVESSTSPGKTKVGVQLWSPQRIKSDFFYCRVGYFSRGGGGMMLATTRLPSNFESVLKLGWILNFIFLLSYDWILVGEIPGHILKHWKQRTQQRYSIHGVRLWSLIFETCASDINGYHLSNHIS